MRELLQRSTGRAGLTAIHLVVMATVLVCGLGAENAIADTAAPDLMLTAALPDADDTPEDDASATSGDEAVSTMHGVSANPRCPAAAAPWGAVRVAAHPAPTTAPRAPPAISFAGDRRVPPARPYAASARALRMLPSLAPHGAAVREGGAISAHRPPTWSVVNVVNGEESS